MTTEELYQLMSKGLDDIKAEMKQGFEQINNRIDSIDNRLRNVETDVAELKGRRLAIKDWIIAACAVGAIIISIISLVK